MSDIMKAVGILQAVRDAMVSTPHYTTSEPFCFAEEIQQLQHAITLLSPPADKPADEPEQPPDTPPPLSGEWQSCEHGIDADDGDWVLYAWRHKLGWQYAAAQVGCDVDDEDGSGTIELLDWDGNQVELEPSDYYMRIER